MSKYEVPAADVKKGDWLSVYTDGSNSMALAGVVYDVRGYPPDSRIAVVGSEHEIVLLPSIPGIRVYVNGSLLESAEQVHRAREIEGGKYPADLARHPIVPEPVAMAALEKMGQAMVNSVMAAAMAMDCDCQSAIPPGDVTIRNGKIESAEPERDLVEQRRRELLRAEEQQIASLGEAGWKSQWYIGPTARIAELHGGVRADYNAWRSARNEFVMRPTEENKAKMLSHVSFTNPPESHEVKTSTVRGPGFVWWLKWTLIFTVIAFVAGLLYGYGLL